MGVGRHVVGVTVAGVGVVRPGVPFAPQTHEPGVDETDARVAVIAGAERRDEVLQGGAQIGAVIVGAGRVPVSVGAVVDVAVEAVRDAFAG